jgi:high-affinity nickel-transport protein
VNTGLEIGVVVTAAGLGFRHGIDWDHIAALTDLTGTQERRTTSMLVATMYAIGHAVMVFALGVLAIVASFEIPSWLDETMTRFVGLTLLALGTYVVVSLALRGREFRMRSRWTLLYVAARRLLRSGTRPTASDDVVVITHDHEHDERHGHAHVHGTADDGVGSESARHAATVATKARHRHLHHHVGTLPDDVFASTGRATAFGVGVLHGVGAETPTQVLLFLAAARAGGAAAGVTLLLCFVVGLVAANTIVALTATMGLLGATRNFPVYATVSLVTAGFSLVVGALFVLGRSALLPPMFGG